MFLRVLSPNRRTSMSSALPVYSFPVPLGRRGTTALAVVVLHVVFALGLIASMVIAPRPKPEPAWQPSIVMPTPAPPVQRAGPADPGSTRLPPLTYDPLPIDPVVPPAPEPLVAPPTRPIENVQPETQVSQVRLLRGEHPPYPASARRLGEEGVVTVRVRVGATGRAELVEVATSSGYPRLDQAAVAAVQKWIFAPSQTASGAIVSWVTLSVRFRLTD
jgi:protein TonB